MVIQPYRLTCFTVSKMAINVGSSVILNSFIYENKILAELFLTFGFSQKLSTIFQTPSCTCTFMQPHNVCREMCESVCVDQRQMFLGRQ